MRDNSAELLVATPGYSGVPPQVYGAVWNPYRRNDGGPGSEFATFGSKHLRTYFLSDEDNQEPQWIATNAQFERFPVLTVKSLQWVPAMHRGHAPGDSCIVTGFADGSIGVWVPPFPTRAGKPYALVSVIPAHEPGPVLGTGPEGSAVQAGCAVLELRADNTLVSGGGDGVIREWSLTAPPGRTPTGQPARGAALRARKVCERVGTPCASLGQSGQCGCQQVEHYLMEKGVGGGSGNGGGGASGGGSNSVRPILSGLACHPDPSREDFIAGTNQQDIWEVDEKAEVRGDGVDGYVLICADMWWLDVVMCVQCWGSGREPGGERGVGVIDGYAVICAVMVVGKKGHTDSTEY